MSLRLLIEILKARFFLVLLTLFITVGSAAVITYNEPREYVSSASMVLNFGDDSPFDNASAVPAQLSSSYLATQLDIIRSQKVARKVVDLRQLDKDPGWRDAYAEAGDTTVQLKDWIASQLVENVEAEALPNSRVVNVTYSALAPDEAAGMANAYAQAFIATSLELTVEPARRNAEWFDDQLKVLRARLDAARSRVSELQSEKGIVALDEKLGVETTRLDDISRNLVEAQMATYAARSRQLGVNHPDYLSAVERERALAASLQNQKQNILRLNSQRDELDTLAREVETEQQNYAATLQTYFQKVMESQIDQGNVVMLSAALPPTSPASPNVILNMLSAVVLGLFLGLMVAVGAELISPRARWSGEGAAV